MQLDDDLDQGRSKTRSAALASHVAVEDVRLNVIGDAEAAR